MNRKRTTIPVNRFGGVADSGIVIEKLAFSDLPRLEEWNQPERHDRHSFFLVETGTVGIEIDFQKYQIVAPSVIYMHPDQVYRILGFKQVTVSSWALANDSLNAEYLTALEDIKPAEPLPLNQEKLAIISDAVSLCLKVDQHYHPVLKNACNTLVGLIIAQYTQGSTNNASRFETVTKAFRQLLEQNYVQLKRPAGYAERLNISIPYLNECVKAATGFPVSYHIQQRILLEAKRLVFHSNLSVKEIAAAVGYEDYPYFSRLFKKVAGLTPVAFRNKNRD